MSPMAHDLAMRLLHAAADLDDDRVRAAAQKRAEAQAQRLADRYRALLLKNAPDDLPQTSFLCILAAVLGRFARDMSRCDPAHLADALGELVKHHARGCDPR